MICLSSMFLLTSCVSNKPLYPISDVDIYKGKNSGDVCFSEFYLKNVLQVKIGER